MIVHIEKTPNTGVVIISISSAELSFFVIR